MIWDKLAFLRALFPARAAAAQVAARWYKARSREPELMADVIRLGGLLTAQPYDPDAPTAPIDPQRLAYEAGRRDLALQLAALMGLTLTELNSLMESNDVQDLDR
jgi:hypothetical protein